MQNKILIAPSILSADFGKLNEEIASVEAFADIISVDIMDGHFVPNITVGMPVVKCVKTKLPIECHLMIENPELYVAAFAAVGAAIISVHYEATRDKTEAILQQIRDLGAKASLAIKPKTEVKEIEAYLPFMDCAVVMSVEPGFGGQAFMPQALEKIRRLRELKPELDIIVDGGINAETAKLCRDAGATILVAGSYVFGAENRAEAIASLRA